MTTLYQIPETNLAPNPIFDIIDTSYKIPSKNRNQFQ